jgi:zinc transport system permease protein
MRSRLRVTDRIAEPARAHGSGPGMMRFLHDMPGNPFLLTGLLAGLMASLACGLIGPYVITRRIVFLAGAIAHMALGGIGAAILLRHQLRLQLAAPDAMAGPAMFSDRPWLALLDELLPTLGAVVAAFFGAVLVGLVHGRVRERIDTLIGAMWAIGMSVGILLIKYTPGYHTELMSFLFGNIVYVPGSQLGLMIGLNTIILLTLILFHKRLLAVCLDEEQALLQGVNVLRTNLVLLTLVALTVICLIQVVGLILVLALLTLPAATAGHHVQRLVPMQLIATLLCILLTTLPRIAVYGTRISPESAIVLAAGGVYLISVVVRRALGRRPPRVAV